jgi:hypothetical protein
METFIGTTFTLGTSTVLTLPKGLGIKAGVRTKIKKVKSGLNIQLKTLPAKDKTIARDIALIKKLAGGIKFSSNLTPKQMNDIYDKEVYG